MNFYAFNIGDYAGATRHLSWDEDMAYRRMLDAYYSREQPLPLEPRQIYRLVGASEPRQREAVDVVLEEFFEQHADGWHNNRADEEIAKTAVKKEKARASALLSVQARQQRSNSEIRRERLAEARGKGTHTDDEWEAVKEACASRCVRCGAQGKLVKDHIVPIYQGGSDSIENLQPLCPSCNSAKGPEAIDHRSPAAQALVKRMLNERSANAGDNSANAGDHGNGRSAPNPNPNPNSSRYGEVVARARDPDTALEHRLREAAGWQSEPSPNLAIIGPIQALIENGADLELDVIPTIKAIAPQAQGRSWNYFVKAIARARDRRVEAATVVSMPSSTNPVRSRANGTHRQKPSRDETFAAIDRRIEQLAEAERRAAAGGATGHGDPDEGAA